MFKLKLMKLFITSLSDIRKYHGQVTHILSMVDPDDGPSIPALGVPPDRHLVLLCDDVDSRAEALRRERMMPGSRCIAPTLLTVKKALAFAKTLPEQATLLIHCGQGISRSPALAFGILCQAQPNLPENEVLQQVMRLRPFASPNALIVAHADELLGRHGRMSQALQSIKL